MKCIVHEILYMNIVKNDFLTKIVSNEYNSLLLIYDSILYDFKRGLCTITKENSMKKIVIPHFFHYLEKFFTRIDCDSKLRKIIFYPRNREIPIIIHNFLF